MLASPATLMRPEHRDRQATLPTGVSWLSEVTNLPVTNADDNSLLSVAVATTARGAVVASALPAVAHGA